MNAIWHMVSGLYKKEISKVDFQTEVVKGIAWSYVVLALKENHKNSTLKKRVWLTLFDLDHDPPRRMALLAALPEPNMTNKTPH